MSVLSLKYFHDEPAAFAHLEGLLWPEGPTCPHCGNADASRITRLQGKAHRIGVHKCNECREQFTVTVNTVLHKGIYFEITLSRYRRPLGGSPSSSADQPLNCLAFVAGVKSLKELLPIEVQYKQPYGR